MARLDGKVALVTRASTGVATACARAFVVEGAHVLLTDEDGGRADAVAAAVDPSGARARGAVHETTSEDDWRRVMTEAARRYGRLDIVVNGPPVVLRQSIAETTLADLRALEEANVIAPWLGLKHAIAAMRSAKSRGSIVNLSLILARVGTAQLAANCATAGGVRVMSQAAALECGQQSDGIRVNSILLPAEDGVDEKEVAAAAVYLASDESRFMTAGEIVLEGRSSGM